jgi:hypothetical protein
MKFSYLKYIYQAIAVLSFFNCETVEKLDSDFVLDYRIDTICNENDYYFSLENTYQLKNRPFKKVDYILFFLTNKFVDTTLTSIDIDLGEFLRINETKLYDRSVIFYANCNPDSCDIFNKKNKGKIFLGKKNKLLINIFLNKEYPTIIIDLRKINPKSKLNNIKDTITIVYSKCVSYNCLDYAE